MSALIGAVCLAILAVINVRVSGSLRYPPALFAGWWALLLAGLACSGDAFFPISARTLAVYIFGPCVMSLGGAAALFSSGRRIPGQAPRKSWECRQGLLTGAVVLLAALFPALWYRIRDIGAASGVRDFWVGVRLQTMQEGSAGASLGVFDYLIFFSTVVALVAVQDCLRRRTGRLRATAAVMLGLAWHLVTASRLGALVLIAGVVGIALVESRSVVRPLAAGALAAAMVFAAVALALNKGGGPGGSVSDRAGALTRSFQLYALGGLVAFQSALEGSTIPAGSEGRTYRVLFVAARAAGRDVELPQLVSQYANTPSPTNVYTFYYPYLTDFGKLGMALPVFVAGWLFSWIYMGAARGAGLFVAAYGIVFGYIVLSSADEYLFSLLSMNCQAVVHLLLLYRRPRLETNAAVV